MGISSFLDPIYVVSVGGGAVCDDRTFLLVPAQKQYALGVPARPLRYLFVFICGVG